MTIFVGSTNPVKINAVKHALIEQWPELHIEGFATKSGVSEQPLTDAETRTGAYHRATSALKTGLKESPAKDQARPVLAFGLEGGVFIDDQDQMWTTVWVSLVDTQGAHFEANGGRVKVPAVIAKKIREGGEMGPVMQELTGHDNIKEKQGMFGVITNNYVDRTIEYSTIARMALGLWYGQGWDTNLSQT